MKEVYCRMEAKIDKTERKEMLKVKGMFRNGDSMGGYSQLDNNSIVQEGKHLDEENEEDQKSINTSW